MRFQNQKLLDELQECKREKSRLEGQVQRGETSVEWLTMENEEIRV